MSDAYNELYLFKFCDYYYTEFRFVSPMYIFFMIKYIFCWLLLIEFYIDGAISLLFIILNCSYSAGSWQIIKKTDADKNIQLKLIIN